MKEFSHVNGSKMGYFVKRIPHAHVWPWRKSSACKIRPSWPLLEKDTAKICKFSKKGVKKGLFLCPPRGYPWLALFACGIYFSFWGWLTEKLSKFSKNFENWLYFLKKGLK